MQVLVNEFLSWPNSDLAWKSGGTSMGVQDISLPGSFRELSIQCYAQSGNYRYGVTYYFVRDELISGGIFYCNGYNAAGEIAMFRIAVSPGTVSLVSAYLGDTDVRESTATAVFYR